MGRSSKCPTTAELVKQYAQEPIARRANGGAAWRSEYPLAARKEWALQFEACPTDAGAQGYNTGGQR